MPRACCQALNFYKKFSVLQYPMSKVNGQSVAATEKSLWAGPTLFYFLFHVKHAPVTCGLWPRLADCGACLWAGPTLIFYFCLRAGGIRPALCFCCVRSLVPRGFATSWLHLGFRISFSNGPAAAKNFSHLRTYAFDRRA